MLEALLEIMFICMITLVTSADVVDDLDISEKNTDDNAEGDRTPGDKFMVWYTVFLLLVTFGFVVALVWYIVAGVRNLQRVKSQKHDDE